MANRVQSLTPRSAVAIVPSDSTLYSDATNGGELQGIYVGAVGDVTVITANGETVTFKAPPIGTILPITVQKVTAATTATLLIGLRYV